MKSRLLGTLGLALLASCGGGSTSPYSGGGGTGGVPACTSTATKVCMVGLTFSPANLTVPVGTTVTWQNGSSTTHTVTSATGSGVPFGSGNVAAGGTFTQTFSAQGTYNYYCMIHGVDGNPPTGMAGTITVQ